MAVSEASAENEVSHMMEMTFLIIPVQQQLELLDGSMQLLLMLLLLVCCIHSDMHFLVRGHPAAG